jgi:hypothetical protein
MRRLATWVIVGLVAGDLSTTRMLEIQGCENRGDASALGSGAPESCVSKSSLRKGGGRLR